LLPRIFDGREHDTGWLPSHEVTCASLARADWLSWTEPLVESIKQVFWAALEKAIAEADGRWVDELICGFALAGLDVAPYLARLEAPDAAKALVKFYECNCQSLMKGKLGNGFWGGDRAKMQPVIAWFASPQVVAIIDEYYRLAA